MSSKTASSSPYRGILKHKLWRPGGGFGTICPTWTHQAGKQGFAGEPDRHPWHLTAAHHLFSNSIDDGAGHRYAAGRGIAFKAQKSNDGTWHGYPIPWEDVPDWIQDALVKKKQATLREMRHQKAIHPNDLKWALNSDAG